MNLKFDFKIEYPLNLHENNLNVQILQIFQILIQDILNSKVIVNVITIRCFSYREKGYGQ